MTLQLSAQSEKVVPYGYFGEGRVVDLMPKLTKAGYVPAGVAVLVDRRQYAPEEVRPTWQKNYFFTGDGSVAGTEGDNLIVSDAQLLRELTAESELYQGALVLPAEAWKELKSQKKSRLHLTADQVQEAQGKGYVKKNGFWTPANKTVAKVWDTLNKGRDLTSYIQLVSESSPHSESLLNVYLNQTTKDGKPTMRPFVLNRFDSISNAFGYYNLNSTNGRLVGVAPKAQVVAREKSDSQGIVQPTLEQTLAIINNPDLNRDGMVKAVSQLYKY